MGIGLNPTKSNHFLSMIADFGWWIVWDQSRFWNGDGASLIGAEFKRNKPKQTETNQKLCDLRKK